MSTRYIKKSIDRIFLLRVSGKGDEAGSANQLEVLRQYEWLQDVVTFRATFKPVMMKASSAEGAKLRQQWRRQWGLRELTRVGRNDFLGIQVTIGRTMFIVYASTASLLDEGKGNAFTRHVCEAIADPVFSGLADPEFMARRDAGGFDNEDHPSVVYAFDPTRFVRSMTAAQQLFDAAAKHLACFEAKDLRVDPAQGDHMKVMWTFLAYGSEMEATVGKQRRFVGRLNKARAGLWPYRKGVTPLGMTCEETERGRVLTVDPQHVASVARLCDLGLRPAMTLPEIARVLATEHGVVSRDPKTAGIPLDELDPSAVNWLLTRRKLTAYRDGVLDVHFVGVMENQLRPGSGHVLTRRWNGHNDQGEPDRHGSITYTIPMPKPTVTGPDGTPRAGWLDGMTDEEEKAAWTHLIRLRGVDERGRRSVQDIQQSLDEVDKPAERNALERALQRARVQRLGGRTGRRAASAICPAYRDADAGENGPRTFLRPRGAGGNFELRREPQAPRRPDGGIERNRSTLLATFHESNLTDAVARVITLAVRRLTDDGQAITAHHIDLPPALDIAGRIDPVAERTARVVELRQEAEAQGTVIGGYELEIAEVRGADPDGRDPDTAERLEYLRAAVRAARAGRRRLKAEADELEHSPVIPAPVAELPALDASDPRDLVVALRGVYSAGDVPDGLLEALRTTIPSGVRFHPTHDLLEWRMVADVALATVAGDVVHVRDCAVTLPSLTGRGGAGRAPDRAMAMAARRMVEGHPIEQIAAAARLADPAFVTRSISAQLNRHNRFPDPAMLALAIDCPITETTRVLHEHAMAEDPPVLSGFAAHIVSTFTQAAPASDKGRKRSGRGHVWAYDLNTDRRLDQLTIIMALPATTPGITAEALSAMLDPDKPRPRWVRDASMELPRNGGTYPPVLRRLPTAGHPNGWYGKSCGTLPEDRKLVGLLPCPHLDCPEPYARVLCPALEVVALGAMMLCRRCRRAATPAGHPMHHTASRTVLPQAYIDWADAQPRRTGAPVPCAAPGCVRDAGFGPGITWRWDDALDPRAWHDADCRAGRTTPAHTRCRYVDCRIDEGGGPGSLRQEGRGRRVWHSRDCQNAELRRLTAEKVEYATCRWTTCQLDEGDGPGSIRKNGKYRTFHGPACARGHRVQERTTP